MHGFGGKVSICPHKSADVLQIPQVTVRKTDLLFSYTTSPFLHLCHYVTHEQSNFPYHRIMKRVLEYSEKSVGSTFLPHHVKEL
jgi:hypothetical protein